MSTKEQALNLLGILATASITGVGFAVGGTIGAAVMTGIGINLSSNIIHSGGAKLKERWLSSNDGILNHDIQQALSRAFIKALTHLETEYFKLGEADALPKNEKESIKALFKELKGQTQEVFPASLQKAIKEQEIKDYLHGGPEKATDKLWERIDMTNILDTYCDHFRNFLRQNLANEVQLWFTEELKTDSKECNKAWRAFQRLLLEGIQADVKAVQASQDLIQQDLQTLEVLKKQLEQLRDTIDHRLPNEPFQVGLEKAISEMQVVLQDVARTAQRTEEKVIAIAAGVKILLDSRVETPKVPDKIQVLKELYTFTGRSSSLTPGVLLGMRPFNKYYYQRIEDDLINESLENKENLLIIGTPLSGKSRAVYEALTHLKEPREVIIPRCKDINPETFLFPGNTEVVVVDDLQKFVEKQDFEHLLNTSIKNNANIVATCRSAMEYEKVKRIMLDKDIPLETIFKNIIELPRISKDAGNEIASEVEISWDDVRFDGTIGSIFMPIAEIERRFNDCNNIEKTILRTLRNLYVCGIYEEDQLFPIEWIKIATKKVGLDGKDFEWFGWFENLREKELITLVKKDYARAEEVYLENIFKPLWEVKNLDVFKEMITTFSDKSEVLFRIGEKTFFFSMLDYKEEEYIKIGIKAFEESIKIEFFEKKIDDYSLGFSLKESGRLEEALERFLYAFRIETSETEAGAFLIVSTLVSLERYEKAIDILDVVENTGFWNSGFGLLRWAIQQKPEGKRIVWDRIIREAEKEKRKKVREFLPKKEGMAVETLLEFIDGLGIFEEGKEVEEEIIQEILKRHRRHERVIEDVLKYIATQGEEERYLFSWDEIPGNDSVRLIDYLKSNYDIDWVKMAKIAKNDNGKAILVTYEKNYLSMNLNNENTELNLKIDNDTTDKFIVKIENGKLNIYEERIVSQIHLGGALRVASSILEQIALEDVEAMKLAIPQISKLLENEATVTDSLHILKFMVKKEPKMISSVIPKLIEIAEDRDSVHDVFSIEIIAEAGKKKPELVEPIIPKILLLLNKEGKGFPIGVRGRAAYIVGCIAESKPEAVKGAFLRLTELLTDNFYVRAHAAFALGCIGLQESIEYLRKVVDDESECIFFGTGEKRTVGEIAREAIIRIERKQK